MLSTTLNTSGEHDGERWSGRLFLRQTEFPNVQLL